MLSQTLAGSSSPAYLADPFSTLDEESAQELHDWLMGITEAQFRYLETVVEGL